MISVTAMVVIAKITDRSGKVVYSHADDVATPFDAKQVGVLTKTLEGVVTSGTGRVGRWLIPVDPVPTNQSPS